MQGAVNLGTTEGFLNTKGFSTGTSWNRIGRYMAFTGANNLGAWLGIHFDLWFKHGGTPLWLLFYVTDRLSEVRTILEPWFEKEGIFCTMDQSDFAVSIDLATGEESDIVVNSVVNRLRKISFQLSALQDQKGVAP